LGDFGRIDESLNRDFKLGFGRTTTYVKAKFFGDHFNSYGNVLHLQFFVNADGYAISPLTFNYLAADDGPFKMKINNFRRAERYYIPWPHRLIRTPNGDVRTA